MNAISAWLLSIAGVVLLCVLSEFVLPEGQINKYCKVIFSFFVVLVVVLPLPSLFGQVYEFSIDYGSESVLQEDFLYQQNLDILTALKSDLIESLQNEGMQNIEVSISADIKDVTMQLESVSFDVSEISFEENINLSEWQIENKIFQIADGFAILDGVEVKIENKT